MRADWQLSTLAEVVQLQRGHDLPATVRGNGSIPVIGSFGVTGHHDEAKYGAPGVAIGRSGASIGVASYVDEPFWPLNTCLFVRDFKGNNPRWVYYLLDSIDFSGYNSGSAQPSLNRNYLAQIPVLLPPVAEQRAIAATLGALDDKIESNRRAAALAQDLMRAKFRDRSSHMAMHEGSLRDIVELVKQPTKAGATPGLPYVPIDSIPMRSLGLDEPRPYEEARSSLSLFRTNDILLGAMRVYFHRVAIAPYDGVTRNTTFVLRAKDERYLSYALLTCDADETISYAEATSKGSTMPYAVWDGGVGDMPLPIPSVEDAEAFHREMWPLVQEIRDGYREQQRLAALRDALLPELLTGRIRVNTEELVSA